MSLRRQKPGTGSSIEFLQRRTADILWADLRDVLRGIPWAIVGTVATRAYMPERMTQGLDILVRKEDGVNVVERLKVAGYTVLSKLTVPGFLLRSTEAVEVKVLFGDQPWLVVALEQLERDPAGYPVLSLPYLVLMKLLAPRIKDWADIPRMLGLASDAQLEQVRKAIARYSPEESDDLEALILLGKKELETPQADAEG